MSREKHPFTVREAVREDYPTLVQVFNDVFHKNIKVRTLEWKYLENPHGDSIVWVAEDRAGKIVGSLAFVPRRMRIQGKEYLSLIAADGMVYPEWQRQGIFIKLLHIQFEKSWALDAPLVYAFSGRRSVKGLIRTNWDEVGLVQERILPLRGRYLFKGVIRRLPFTAGLAGLVGDILLVRGRLRGLLQHTPSTEIKVAERFDAALARVGDAVLEDRPVSFIRDEAFLNWRYVDNPSKRHRIFVAYRKGEAAGYLVMETDGGKSCVADLLAVDREARVDLLAAAVREGREQGGEMLQCMALEGDELDRFLSEQGVKCLPRIGLLPFMIKMGPAGGSLKSVVTDPSLWYLSHGDKDVEYMTP